jgi:hypothetical protein
MCKEIYRKIPIFMLESVGKFHCGYWNVMEMSTVPVDIHMLENSISPVVWSCDIHYICRNFASVLVIVYQRQREWCFIQLCCNMEGFSPSMSRILEILLENSISRG